MVKQIFSLTDESQLVPFYIIGAVIVLLCGYPLVYFIDHIGLKLSLFIGFMFDGTGLILQGFYRVHHLFTLWGYIFVSIGDLFPFISVALVAKDWFQHSQRLTIIAFWQQGRVIGQTLSFLCNYYYFDLSSTETEGENLKNKYSMLLKGYIALVLSSAIITFVYVKSTPEGIERSRKIEEHRTVRGSICERAKPLILNQHLGTETATLAIHIIRLKSLQKIKIVLGDKFIWVFGVGCLLPLGATGFGEIYILKNMNAFGVNSVR